MSLGAIRVSEAILLILEPLLPGEVDFFMKFQHLRLATGHPCKHGVNMGTLIPTKLIENKFSGTSGVNRRLRNKKLASYAQLNGANPTSVSSPASSDKCHWRKENYYSKTLWKSHLSVTLGAIRVSEAILLFLGP